ncbi:DUF2157 domain-containing protein [Propionivibrio sp.]|uniref:DUF2157 domain-containing protein n=1 Tax=Propionivibrio sp. TaxID=2212460 RepID=UPI0025DAB013|nr:DUF2157 domain-containing protein [Propionivibrio sp.]MBK7356254.1 DUF2157 domain-containing protein [Propionivibrio sp.]MBK8746205.1 DUF2157 domain-containing protein [Propionivibrio sp.]MBK8894484.1 DUF2157 domain-containing protein [Propionivibrio sp.]MBL0208363.1 DUF2157 domain-containing protein [Propionivibrio sp.]
MTPITTRRYLESLARSGQLSAPGLEFALKRIGAFPNSAQWLRFADRLLLVAGTLLILAGVLYFFAFNWNELHRFTKISLVVLLLFISASMMAYTGPARAEGKVWLGAGVVFIGLLLAVVGQIYQTGADTESLFAGWALLALPWVSISCAPWLWLFWLLLVNTAMALFLVGRIDILMVFFYSDAMFWGPLLFNALALSVWEFLWPRVDWMRVTYAPRFIVFLAAIAATGLGASWWFLTRRVEWQLIHFAPIGYLIWLSVTIWHYGKRRQDIVPLALSALSCIAVLTAGLISTLFGSRHFDVVSFFVIGVAVATMTAAAAAWLRLTSSRWSKIREVRGA